MSIICIEPGCGAIISDPCEPVTVLFLNKQKILNLGTSRFNLSDSSDLRIIESKLEQTWGLSDHQKHYEAFVNPGSVTARTIGPKVFLLKCFRGHRNQYSITCP